MCRRFGRERERGGRGYDWMKMVKREERVGEMRFC